MVYVNILPLDTLSIDSTADKYKNFMRTASGHLRVLRVTKHTLTGDKTAFPILFQLTELPVNQIQ